MSAGVNSDWLITKPLSAKKTSTAAPPCDTACWSHSGKGANGAI